MKWPQPEIRAEDQQTIARIVAHSSLLPNPDTVAAFPNAVFPTCRRKRESDIAQVFSSTGVAMGIYDNNATPTWAICWTHGIEGKRPKGWTVAHVWPSSDDIDGYTRLANLALVPEALSTTTDKSGPLTDYLRWHAWIIYKWKPKNSKLPVEPSRYREIDWQYLEKLLNPREALGLKFGKSNDKRARALRELGYSPPRW